MPPISASPKTMPRKNGWHWRNNLNPPILRITVLQIQPMKNEDQTVKGAQLVVMA